MEGEAGSGSAGSGLNTSDTQNIMEGDAGLEFAGPGTTGFSSLNAIIIALNETCHGKIWYTSTKELQLASLELCIACRSYSTLHLTIDQNTPRRLLAAADAPPPHSKRLCGTRLPRLRARTVTWNMPTAVEMQKPVFAMTDMDSLVFGRAFEGSLEAVAWPRRLKTIEMPNSPFNKPIDLVKWPASLQRVCFGNRFNQPIAGSFLLTSLREFDLGTDFDQPIEGVIWPDSLQKLEFGTWFNQSLERVKFPASLQTIILGATFNRPIDRVEFPASLVQLIVGSSCFDQPIAGVLLPTSLQELDLGEEFNQPIEDMVWPPSLRKLNLGFEFNQPIQRVVLPSSLQEFTVMGKFNHPIEGVSWPDSLQRLILGSEFNQPIDNVRWPASLQDITFASYEKHFWNNTVTVYAAFNQSIGSSVWPESLRRLTLAETFEQSLQGLGSWMPNLEALRLLDHHNYKGTQNSLLRGIEWPKGLRELTVFKDSNLDGVVIPSTVQVIYRYNANGAYSDMDV